MCYFNNMAKSETSPIREKFSPLSERALRSDGTIGIKIIEDGWGASGYYSREVLERDIPNIFPAGTQMFWNHPTSTENAERPEGDLNDLSAVTISAPIWLQNGANGPGMYADVRPFSGYSETIDEIGEHIGVSIRAMGAHTFGEVDGQSGRIINELIAGRSIDFVTQAGAGGAIVQVFESANGAGKLPDLSIQEFLSEAGRVLSAKNEMMLKSALGNLMAVLAVVDIDSEDEDTDQTGDLANESEDDMSDKELKESQEALASVQAALDKNSAELTESNAALAVLQESALLQKAADFVNESLSDVELHPLTKARLSKSVLLNAPIVDGAVNEAELKTRIDTAVTEAMAEITAIVGQTGQVTGMGGRHPAGTGTVEESLAIFDTALAGMGYGAVSE